jgi:hypothetical protein
MHTFWEFVQLHRLANSLRLAEHYYGLDKSAYDQVFVGELKRLEMQIPDGKVRRELEEFESFPFTSFISNSVYRSGVFDPREIDERTHDIVAKLLIGTFFHYNPAQGPISARFRVSVANAIRNQIEKVRNQRKYLPRAPMSSGDVAARSRPNDESAIQDFRTLVGSRLGQLGVAVLDLRLSGSDTKSLIGSVEHGQPSAYRIKQTVLSIKSLAGEFARSRGDEGFMRQVERAMQAEEATVRRRVGARQVRSEVTG